MKDGQLGKKDRAGEQEAYGKMNAKQLEEFRNELLAQREEVLRRIREHAGARPVGPTESHDWEDEASDRTTEAVHSRLGQSEDRLLEKIELALRQISEGDYGRCLQCGADIPLERLQAKPSVSLCVSCQSAKEKEEALRR
ncbi:MAG TPA: TraR/DksA family transcriptional regulator [Verrucomicrobiales bacterium]|nr:TraR/DksA family transcriptional regulator [Verrucomicrobiales bacterium]